MGQLQIDQEFVKGLCSDIDKVVSAAAVFRSENYSQRPTQLSILNDKIDKFALKYYITGHRSKGLPPMHQSQGEYTGGATVRQFMMPFGEVCTLLTESLLFDESFEMPETVRQVHEFNWQGIPPTVIDKSINYSFSKHLVDDTMVMLDDEEF